DVDTSAFLNAVAANKSASANLAASINSNQIFGLFSHYRGTEGAPQALLHVFTVAAAQQKDPGQLKALTEKLSAALIEMPPEGSAGGPQLRVHMTAAELQAFLPLLLRFVQVTSPGLIPRLPTRGEDAREYQKELTSWGQDAGENLRVFEAFGKWVGLNDEEIAKGRERHDGGWVTFFAELAVGTAVLTLPELGLPAELFLHAALGVGVYEIEPSITRLVTEPGIARYNERLSEIINREIKGEQLQPGESKLDPEKALRKYIWLSSRTQLVLRAFNSGRVVNGSKPVNLADVTGRDGLSKLAALIADRNKDWA
ncbi:MAG: hypothetical protein QOE61_174, partial [Micromonosporaceae bacterium]|nr:hypothetical protein [Micromonosporaceae bacterium]